MSNRIAKLSLAVLLAACLGSIGCRSSSTDIQIRDAQDHAALVGHSIGTPGPLHAAYRWSLTDTDGAANVRTRRDWDELRIVVAAPGRRTIAEGVLHPGTSQWVALDPSPQPSGRRVEARIVNGEGAPPHAAQQSQD